MSACRCGRIKVGGVWMRGIEPPGEGATCPECSRSERRVSTWFKKLSEATNERNPGADPSGPNVPAE